MVFLRSMTRIPICVLLLVLLVVPSKQRSPTRLHPDLFRTAPIFGVTTATPNITSLEKNENQENLEGDAQASAGNDISSPTRTGAENAPDGAMTLPQNSTTLSEDIPEWKRGLPAPLSKKKGTLQRISVPGPGGRHVVIYLLGTAHVSIDSSRDVRAILEAIQPNVVFLELCDQRIPLLVVPGPSTSSSEGGISTTAVINDSTNNSTPSSIDEAIAPRLPWWKQLKQSESKSLYSTAAILLTNMQQDYADSLGVELGGEFRVAHNYWASERLKRRHEAFHLILGDRPLYLTLTRAWESLGLWGKTKLLVGLLISSLSKPNADELREWMQSVLADDSGDLLSKSIAELRQHFPSLEEVIIRERDAYMACKLYQTCRQIMSDQYVRGSGSREPFTIVAIVGAGHVSGICHWLTVGNGQSPEIILDGLITTKKGISETDRRSLVYDVMEVSHDLLQELIKQTNK